MLIPRILRDDVPFININHSRDFIHVDDLVRGIDTLMKTDLTGVTDLGAGITNKLMDLVDYFKVSCDKFVLGNEFERLDNKADNTLLNNLGWLPEINLYNYIEENRNVN